MDRFDKDFAAAEKMRRQQEFERKNQLIEEKRQNRVENEIKRRHVMEEEEDKHEKKWVELRTKYGKGIKSCG